MMRAKMTTSVTLVPTLITIVLTSKHCGIVGKVPFSGEIFGGFK